MITEGLGMPEIGMILREGKGKKVYATDDPDKAIVYFKDEAMAFHGLKRGRILGKGEVNNSVCEHLFHLLDENGIANHFIERIDARHSLIRRCDMIPLRSRSGTVRPGSWQSGPVSRWAQSWIPRWWSLRCGTRAWTRTRW